MRHHSKLLIAVIAAIALLGMAVSAASARRFQIPNWEMGFKISWRPMTVIAGGNEIRCPVILEGEYLVHEFTKIAGTRIAKVTEARTGVCERGRLILKRETLPWERTYQSFRGTLPNITGIRFRTIGIGFQVENGMMECTGRTTAERPGSDIALVTSGEVTGDEAESGATIETSGGFFCAFPGEASFSGPAEGITVKPGPERIRIRLI